MQKLDTLSFAVAGAIYGAANRLLAEHLDASISKFVGLGAGWEGRSLRVHTLDLAHGPAVSVVR